ncbi:protoglobin domain-containing protein [Amycolatopsis sp. NPDC004079]|uniref:protoglobin domain-containing protein n=1 Tax=Amycolatopsis sp. NPDC004079 TaxID=3154549 RepID=UPI0033B4ACED
MNAPAIPGYTHDDPALPASPVTAEDLEKLKATVLFGPDDEAALRTAGEVLNGQIEQVLDVWYGFVGSHPHLLAYFSTPSGEPIADYLGRVRSRFGQWIVDQADSVPHIPLRYLIAFSYPISVTIRPFLAAGGHSEEQDEAMFQAWFNHDPVVHQRSADAGRSGGVPVRVQDQVPGRVRRAPRQ